MKNKLLQVFFSHLQKKRGCNEGNCEKILIVSTTALGDTLWATPALEDIRKSYPKSFISILTSNMGAQVLENNPHLDQIITIREPLLYSGYFLRKALLREKFDTVLIFHTSQRLILPIVSSIGAKRIIGTEGINKGLDGFLTEKLPLQKEHEIVRRQKIAEKIGVSIQTHTLSFFLKEEERVFKEKKQIAMHPGSKDGFKRWPKEHFIKLGRELQKKGDFDLWITGTKEEKPLVDEIAEAIPNAKALASHLSLREFAVKLKQMDLLISNDTGPVHLACALNVPVIAIYSATDPFLCGPHRAAKAIALGKRASCNPCLKRKCLEPFCMLQISPEEVLDQLFHSMA